MEKQKTIKTKPIWISFDLGVSGNYEKLFQWLDGHGAKECGDSLAYIKDYPYKDDLAHELRRDIIKSVKSIQYIRVYVVWSEGSRTRARFLIGGRKGAPWAGCAPSNQEEEDE